MINGDFVAHGISSSDPSVSNWNLMKTIIQTSIDRIKSKFPNVPILPSIGNNDVLFHYQAPSLTEKTNYYADLYQIWFSGVETNADYPDLSDILTSFSDGGYYRYDISDSISYIALNSIYFNSQNS